jgi:hypothetical protein
LRTRFTCARFRKRSQANRCSLHRPF